RVLIRRPRMAALFPYTTLFRSRQVSVELNRRERLLLGEIHTSGRDQAIHDEELSSSELREPHLTPVFQFDNGEDLEVRRSLRPRSEEHTSELQSRENLVCRLLL